jgi:NTE family protein
MSEKLQDNLINWGYAVCDAGMRRWVCPGTTLKPEFPYPGSGVG